MLTSRGRTICDRWLLDDLPKAVSYHKKALALDPNYGAAWANLAVCSYHNLIKGDATMAAGCPDARRAANKAIELDGGNADAHAAFGLISLFCDWDWIGADRAIARSIELGPSGAYPLFARSFQLNVAGRFEEAGRTHERWESVEPGLLQPVISHGWALLAAGRYEQAAHQLRQAIDLDPSSPWPRAELTLALTRLGRVNEAHEHYAIARKLSPPLHHHAADYWVSEYELATGRTDILRKIVDSRVATYGKDNTPADHIAAHFALLGDTANATRWLERAYADRSWGLALLNTRIFHDKLRALPAFQSIRQRMNFPTVPPAPSSVSPPSD